MGINVRTTDLPTELGARVTAGREKRERDVRARVRSGEISLDTYLIQHRGFKAEHLASVRHSFAASIFGTPKRV